MHVCCVYASLICTNYINFKQNNELTHAFLNVPFNFYFLNVDCEYKRGVLLAISLLLHYSLLCMESTYHVSCLN